MSRWDEQPNPLCRPPRARLPKRLLALRGDDALVARLQAGDEVAFEVLFDRYSAPLLSFCRHMLGRTDEAEDAVQQVFASAHADLQRNPREPQLKPWLYTIARNRCLSMLRARREQPSDEVEPSTAGLQEQVQARADLRELVADLGDLPENQRAALLLTELEDLSHAEAATVLDCEASQVKGLVFRAREGLIERRDARSAPCEEIRAELSTARTRRAPPRPAAPPPGRVPGLHGLSGGRAPPAQDDGPDPARDPRHRVQARGAGRRGHRRRCRWRGRRHRGRRVDPERHRREGRHRRGAGRWRRRGHRAGGRTQPRAGPPILPAAAAPASAAHRGASATPMPAKDRPARALGGGGGCHAGPQEPTAAVGRSPRTRGPRVGQDTARRRRHQGQEPEQPGREPARADTAPGEPARRRPPDAAGDPARADPRGPGPSQGSPARGAPAPSPRAGPKLRTTKPETPKGLLKD